MNTVEKVKELRVKIDGLSQLVKQLNNVVVLDLAKIPEGWDVDKWIYYIKTMNYQVVDNKDKPEIIDLNKSEVINCYNSLILAKAWLGKILQELNVESPYKSGYKTKEDIEPTADKAKNEVLNQEGALNIGDYLLLPNWGNMSYIEKVDLLRTQIKKLVDNTEDFSLSVEGIDLEQGFVYKYLCEARFWLGFELQRIKETTK